MLAFYIFFSFAHCFTFGENFLPTVLKSKIKNSFQFNSNKTYSKVWMKYLERKLEIMNLPLERRNMINSLLEFYNRNFRYNISNEMPSNCDKVNFKEFDGLQISIYGDICGLSAMGKLPQKKMNPLCESFDFNPLLWKTICYNFISKYKCCLSFALECTRVIIEILHII